jgi:hypothetical protein
MIPLKLGFWLLTWYGSAVLTMDNQSELKDRPRATPLNSQQGRPFLLEHDIDALRNGASYAPSVDMVPSVTAGIDDTAKFPRVLAKSARRSNDDLASFSVPSQATLVGRAKAPESIGEPHNTVFRFGERDVSATNGDPSLAKPVRMGFTNLTEDVFSVVRSFLTLGESGQLSSTCKWLYRCMATPAVIAFRQLSQIDSSFAVSNRLSELTSAEKTKRDNLLAEVQQKSMEEDYFIRHKPTETVPDATYSLVSSLLSRCFPSTQGRPPLVDEFLTTGTLFPSERLETQARLLVQCDESISQLEKFARAPPRHRDFLFPLLVSLFFSCCRLPLWSIPIVFAGAEFSLRGAYEIGYPTSNVALVLFTMMSIVWTFCFCDLVEMKSSVTSWILRSLIAFFMSVPFSLSRPIRMQIYCAAAMTQALDLIIGLLTGFNLIPCSVVICHLVSLTLSITYSL